LKNVFPFQIKFVFMNWDIDTINKNSDIPICDLCRIRPVMLKVLGNTTRALL
jgi:hypothetical protein